MPIYDAHIAVDWSAANSPRRGKDSIWINENGARGINISTRAEAMAWVEARIARALADGERLHIGFDFAFGLTRGAAEALLGEGGWQSFWTFLHDAVEEGSRNASNRFAVGERLNMGSELEGPF